MKKLTVLLAGFGLGVSLIAGSCGSSRAEEKGLVLQKDTLLSGPVIKIQADQERIKKNFVYQKPDPVKPLKVTGEFLSGGAGALTAGAVGAGIGYLVARRESESGVLDFSGLEGAGAGYLVLSPIGCALVVYLIGNIGEDEGSYPATLGGSAVGTLLGFGIISSMVKGDGPNEPVLPAIVLFTAAQAAGATVGFNLSRKKKVEVSPGALLNLNEGRLALSFPRVNLSTYSKSSSSYKVNLFQAKF